MNLGHITIRTAFFEEEITFYKKTAGLKIVRDLRELGSDIVFLADREGDTKIEIIKTPGAENSGNDCISIGFHTDSAEALHEQLQENGLAPGPITSPAPPVRFFFVKDPAGVRVQFVEERI